jgi:hypothetical protein
MRVAKTGCLAALLIGAVAAFPSGAVSEAEVLEVRKGFHIAGIPKLMRDARVDLTLTPMHLLVRKGKKEVLRLPYERIRAARRLVGEREYPGATAALVATIGAPGALMLMKKRKVETLIFEFLNDRNGQMAAVLQVPKEAGPGIKEWLARCGVTLEDPPPPQWPPAKNEKKDGDATIHSK